MISQRPSPRRILRLAAILVAGIVLIKVSLAFIFSRQLHATVVDLQQYEPSIENIPLVRRELRQANSQLYALQSALWPFQHVAIALRHGGVIANEAAVSAYTLNATSDLLNAVVLLDNVYEPILRQLDQSVTGEQLLEQLSDLSEQHATELDTINQHIMDADAALSQITVVRNRQLREIVEQLTAAQQVLEQVGFVTDALPTLLGTQKPHHILILLQNADELRATGGFITASAYLTIEDGKIAEQSILVSTDPAIDRFGERLYAPPPEPMAQYMKLRLWLFRDANWSPDYPVAATQAATLYTYGRDVPVDTVVAIDQYTLKALLAFTGDIELDDGRVISAENIIDLMHDSWLSYRAEDYRLRKAFIADLAPLLLSAFMEQLSAEKLPTLIETIQEIGREKQLLLYSNQPVLQQLWESANWDGAIDLTVGDYLYPVSTNLGYNKSDLNMFRTLNYHVSLQELENPYGKLTLTFTNQGNATAGLCRTGEFVQLSSYVQQATDCNVNYLRLYLPDNSEMASVPTYSLPDAIRWIENPTAGLVRKLPDERGKSVFAALVVTPPQVTTAGEYLYRLQPSAIFHLKSADTLAYRLTVPKQPGTRATTTRISIDLPPDLTVQAVSPTPIVGNANVISYELLLEEDLEIEVIFNLTKTQLASIERLLQSSNSIPPQRHPRIVPTQLPVPIEP